MLEQEHLLSKQVGAKKASERSQKNLADRLKASGLKLPLYPKGAVRDCRIWLNKTLSEYRNGYINSFVLFSSASELLRAAPVVWDYPICIPFKRVKQLRATATGFEPVSPSTWNLIIYGPPINQALTDIDKVSLFYDSFRDLGRVIYSEYAGDGWNKDLEYYEENTGSI